MVTKLFFHVEENAQKPSLDNSYHSDKKIFKKNTKTHTITSNTLMGQSSDMECFKCLYSNFLFLMNQKAPNAIQRSYRFVS